MNFEKFVANIRILISENELRYLSAETIGRNL